MAKRLKIGRNVWTGRRRTRFTVGSSWLVSHVLSQTPQLGNYAFSVCFLLCSLGAGCKRPLVQNNINMTSGVFVVVHPLTMEVFHMN